MCNLEKYSCLGSLLGGYTVLTHPCIPLQEKGRGVFLGRRIYFQRSTQCLLTTHSTRNILFLPYDSSQEIALQWIAQWTQWIIQSGISIETCFCWPQKKKTYPWTHTGKDGSFQPRAFVESAAILTLAKSWPWPTPGGFSDDLWHLVPHVWKWDWSSITAPHRKNTPEPPCLAVNTSWRNYEASPWQPWMKTTAKSTLGVEPKCISTGATHRNTIVLGILNVQGSNMFNPCSTYKFHIRCEFWHQKPILPIPPWCWQ